MSFQTDESELSLEEPFYKGLAHTSSTIVLVPGKLDTLLSRLCHSARLQIDVTMFISVLCFVLRAAVDEMFLSF
jgi:hypothetical protein